jgi:hypothetical protein
MDGFDCSVCHNQYRENKQNPPCLRDGCHLAEKLEPENIPVWRFFWAMDQMGYDYAKDHFRSVLQFDSEFDHGSFYERLNLLKRKVEALRYERIKNGQRD